MEQLRLRDNSGKDRIVRCYYTRDECYLWGFCPALDLSSVEEIGCDEDAEDNVQYRLRVKILDLGYRLVSQEIIQED